MFLWWLNYKNDKKYNLLLIWPHLHNFRYGYWLNDLLEKYNGSMHQNEKFLKKPKVGWFTWRIFLSTYQKQLFFLPCKNYTFLQKQKISDYFSFKTVVTVRQLWKINASKSIVKEAPFNDPDSGNTIQEKTIHTKWISWSLSFSLY